MPSCHQTLAGVELLTVITDMESSNTHLWIDPFVDEAADGCAHHTIVAGGDRLQQQAAAAGYPEVKVLRTDGMVVHPSYYTASILHADPMRDPAGGQGARSASVASESDVQEAAAPGASVEGALPSIVIFFGGYAPPRTEKIAERLLLNFSEHVRLVVLCGKNEALRAKLKARVDIAFAPRASALQKRWANTVVEGFIPPTRLTDHMSSAACVIGKPGPGAASEAAVMGVPFVTEVNSYTLPQELCVVDWLLTTNFGVVVKSLEDFPPNLLEQLDSCKQALRSYSNRAVFQVAARIKALMLAAPVSFGTGEAGAPAAEAAPAT